MAGQALRSAAALLLRQAPLDVLAARARAKTDVERDGASAARLKPCPSAVRNVRVSPPEAGKLAVFGRGGDLYEWLGLATASRPA
jgi:hypothetical protein